jgi:hypothetical protein
MLLDPNQHDEKGKQEAAGYNSLSINYSKLNIDLLMNIIESRQKILIQRIEFDFDFNTAFLLQHSDDQDTDEKHDDDDNNNNNDNDHDNNEQEDNNKQNIKL